MKRFRDLSLKTKLTVLLVSASGLALLLACTAFVANNVVTVRSSTVSHLSAVADVVGANTTAAVTFHDREVAAEALASLRHEPIVRFACVYDREGRPFATYHRSDLTDVRTPPPVRRDGHRFTSRGTLEVFKSISDRQDRVGTLYVEAGMEHLHAQIGRSVLMALGVLVVSLLASLAVSARLQNVVWAPIARLAQAAKRISEEHDYSVRVRAEGNDEIGALYEEFNHMLAQIEAGQRQLRGAHDELEQRVEERTRQLSQAVDDLSRENAERRRAEEDLKTLQHEHLAAARRAGMAEVATSVLHNVGNVLNSINVSTSLIVDRMRKLGVRDFRRAAGIIEEHADEFGRFVIEDERGRHLPRFLIELSGRMAADERVLRDELELLMKNVDHIKDIIAVQQSHAGLNGLVEEVRLAELIEDAIRINSASTERHRIEIVREFEDLPPVAVEKQKIMQILVNLISNAKYALIESRRERKRIVLRLSRGDGDRVRIEVADNGIGILAQNLTRIFSHGFTTRRDGHGFGLHSAALAADDLRGTLTARSDGLGRGATFTIEIPSNVSEAEPCTPAMSHR
ncbi:MAG: CHASE sensor domain-containing protein [Planctomycetaceae bacterium]